MALINTQPTVAPEVAATITIKQIATDLYNQMLPKYNLAYNLVWNNPKVAADKVIGAMGTDAQTLFAVSAGLAEILTACGANVKTTMPSGWTFTANGDGSVTLTKV